jgi:hypothetical protein
MIGPRLQRLLKVTAAPNPRKYLRDHYAIFAAACLVNAVLDYGSWALLFWFALGVYLAASCRAEHRALKAWPTQAALYVFHCGDCKATVARITLPINVPPPDKHEIHNGSPIPYKPDTLHHCIDAAGLAVDVTVEVK